MIALFVDGPASGSVRDIGATDAELLVSTDLGPIHRAIYHIHHFGLVNRTIRVASIHPIVEDINLDDAFALIVSDLAKEAVIIR
jgi:hypothetical protein